MTDDYSTMTANEWAHCSHQNFNDLRLALEVEQQKIEAADVSICIQVECNKEEGVFVFAKDCFGIDDLTENVCLQIGQLLSSSGRDSLGFAFSQTASRIMARSYGGGCFRIYSDGRLSWPKDIWSVMQGAQRVHRAGSFYWVSNRSYNHQRCRRNLPLFQTKDN